MSHSWDCPDRWTSEREARKQAEEDARRGGYHSSYDRAARFSDCDESNYVYRREYEAEARRIEDAREERRREEEREERARHDREQERRHYEQMEEQAYYDAMAEAEAQAQPEATP